jgi:hypothetical protein
VQDIPWAEILGHPLTIALVGLAIIWIRYETAKIQATLRRIQDRNDRKDGTNGYAKPPTTPPASEEAPHE